MKAVILLILFFLCYTPTFVQAQMVYTDNIYTYDALTEDMVELSQAYPNVVTYKPLTTTEYGRKVWAIKLGHGETSILLNGAHHAREWMTSALLMKMIESYAGNYEKSKIHRNILDEVSLWFVPMVNPDGVTLQQFGHHAFPNYTHTNLIKMNGKSTNFKRWKANLNGIDLNRQYPANWENIKGTSKKPSYQFYKGSQPVEAEEVKALVDFTYEIKPEIAVSYHSSGNVLFWGFNQWGLTHSTKFANDYYSIAEKIAAITKYKLEEPATHQQGGGYTDWFIEEFEKPALTVEIGNLIEENSLPVSEFPEVWERNKTIGLFLAKKALERTNETKRN